MWISPFPAFVPGQIGVVKLTPPGASYIGKKPTVAGFGRINDREWNNPPGQPGQSDWQADRQTTTLTTLCLLPPELAVISDVLRYAELPVVSNDLCYASYGDTDKSQICLQTDEVKASSCSVRSPA